MSDLDEIKRRKLEELQQRYYADSQSQAQEQADMQQQIAQLEAIVKRRMTKEAVQRFGNIKSADPDKAVQVIAIIGQLMQRNSNETIDDEKLKKILMLINVQKRETKITRK